MAQTESDTLHNNPSDKPRGGRGKGGGEEEEDERKSVGRGELRYQLGRKKWMELSTSTSSPPLSFPGWEAGDQTRHHLCPCPSLLLLSSFSVSFFGGKQRIRRFDCLWKQIPSSLLYRQWYGPISSNTVGYFKKINKHVRHMRSLNVRTIYRLPPSSLQVKHFAIRIFWRFLALRLRLSLLLD